jgi:hypothetical protein
MKFSKTILGIVMVMGILLAVPGLLKFSGGFSGANPNSDSQQRSPIAINSSPDLTTLASQRTNPVSDPNVISKVNPERQQKGLNSMNKSTIEAVKAASEQSLMAIPGVMGVGIGLNGDRQPCIKVYVDRQSASAVNQIPKTIEGYSVEVEVRGTFRAQ